MIIKVLFYKTSSKYYDSVCLQCENFKNYVQEKSANTLTLEVDDIRQRGIELKNIFEIIRHWKKTEYFIDEKKVQFSDIDNIFDNVECEKECNSCMFADEHCFESAGWGCKFINTIALRENSYYPYYSRRYWYEFGYFENDVWKIDKLRIRSILKEEVEEKNIAICKSFSFERLERSLKTLPDIIEITDDGEWEYKYRDAPMGMKQSEIIGVKPKEKVVERRGSTISLSLFGNEQKEVEKTEKNIPSTTFENIGGIDKIVRQVREVIELPLIAPALFEHYHIRPHRGILLYGPPGCGKTLIAKAIANEIKAHFISVNGPEILNKFIGQSEAELRKIFEEAKKMGPSIIYFDEFDSISSTRDADGNPLMATVVNQLLTLMDGINENNRICVIASTNRIDMIDEAIKRPGRFDYIIEIQRPSPDGCKAIFEIHTVEMPVIESFNKESFVDQWLIGCSGAEIAFVASEAAYNSIRRTVDIEYMFTHNQEINISKENIIIEEDFVKAAKKLKETRKH